MRASFAFGVFCAVAGAALWGFSGACAQFLFAGYEISALFITVVRMLGAGVLFAIVLVARWRNDLKRLFADRASLARLLVFGSLIGAVEPVSAMLCSCLWLATPFGAADWAGLVLMIVTIVLVSVHSKTSGARP